MKSLIKKLLRENIESVETQELFKEGKKLFSNLKMFMTTTKSTTVPELRFFINYPSNKGSYTPAGFKAYLGSHKLDKIYRWILSKKIKITKSNTTNSIYFSLKNKAIRMSDHKRRSFEGIDLLVDWKTNPQEIANQIKNIYNEIIN